MSVAVTEIPRPIFDDVAPQVWRRAATAEMPAVRKVPEESPVAFVYQGASYAVMMATPADLEDFAVGFTLNERIAASPGDIDPVEVLTGENGVVLRITLAEASATAFWERRRYLAGPSGCGLCGLESLAEAIRRPPPVGPGISVFGEDIAEAMAALPGLQPMNRITGALLLTSRVSVEMVQKAASFGAPVLVAVSAPTALAIRTAEMAGITLVAVARHDGFEVFTHPQRILYPKTVVGLRSAA